MYIMSNIRKRLRQSRCCRPYVLTARALWGAFDVYTELAAPFTGWSVDQDGTVHTPSGYRCMPQMIESALWLLGIASTESKGRLMFNAERDSRDGQSTSRPT